MLFNSYDFLFGFLPVTLAVFFGLGRLRATRLAMGWLVLASLAFYGYWSLAYLPLLVASIAFNFGWGRLIERQAGRPPGKALLAAGVVANLALLGYFKYADFFVEAANKALHAGLTLPGVVLPLGISFFTFTQIAFLVDTYRGVAVRNDFLSYALFVTYFPHLIAGPILHHKDVLPQFHRLRHFVFSHRNFAIGLAFLAIGLFKKVMVADHLAPWVAPVFNHAATATFLEAWTGALAYALQLYFDFSGYSDMAIGLALMLNVRIPFNFDSPYQATSIIDFWRRWHMSLSAFLRDYLYIALGGNRLGEMRRFVNLGATMVLGGLWHGAGWTFVAWGALHGAFLMVNHGWRKVGQPLPRWAAWPLTFGAVVVAWVFFRAHSFWEATQLLQAMVGLKGVVLPLGWQPVAAWAPASIRFGALPYWAGGEPALLAIASLIAFTAFAPNTQQVLRDFRPWPAMGLVGGLATAVVLLSMSTVSEFLYFQF